MRITYRVTGKVSKRIDEIAIAKGMGRSAVAREAVRSQIDLIEEKEDFMVNVIYLDPLMKKQLLHTSERTNKTVSELIRECLELYIVESEHKGQTCRTEDSVPADLQQTCRTDLAA